MLQLADIDTPTIADDEVLIRVCAAGVDPGVWHLMTGLPYLIRLFGFGLTRPKNPVPGMDVAGVVEAVGKNVTTAKPGDEVYGICKGAYAEYACAKAAKLAPKPANLTFTQAAAVPISATTALQALRDVAKVKPGQTVLIVGASGGVGSFAVQLAKAMGAHVTGVCSTSKLDLVRSLGADDVIDYTREDFADGQRKFDAILDIAGNRALSHLRRALTPRGTLVIVGGESGGRWLGGTDRQLRAMLLSLFIRQTLTSFINAERRDDLLYLKDLLEAGRVTPVIDRTFPLSEAPDAVRHWMAGHARGKTVVTVHEPAAGPL